MSNEFKVKNGLITPFITIGSLGYTATNVLLSMQSVVAGFNQMVLRNTSADVTASSDIIINNNLSTDTTYYGDFGINSSTYTGSGSINLANATYLTATTGDLVLGTTTANAIHLVINNAATDALTIATTGNITATGTITAPALIASNGIVLNTTNITANYTIAAGNNAMSIGPITVAAGVTVTVTAGQRWVIL